MRSAVDGRGGLTSRLRSEVNWKVSLYFAFSKEIHSSSKSLLTLINWLTISRFTWNRTGLQRGGSWQFNRCQANTSATNQMYGQLNLGRFADQCPRCKTKASSHERLVVCLNTSCGATFRSTVTTVRVEFMVNETGECFSFPRYIFHVILSY